MDERQLTYSNELHLGKEKKIPSSFVLQNPQTVCFITEPYRQERTQGRARAGVTLCNLSSFRKTKKIICLLFFECALEKALKATRASKIPLALGTHWYFWMKRIEFDAVWGLCELSYRPESSPSSCKPHRKPQREQAHILGVGGLFPSSPMSHHHAPRGRSPGSPAQPQIRIACLLPATPASAELAEERKDKQSWRESTPRLHSALKIGRQAISAEQAFLGRAGHSCRSAPC